MGAPPHGNKVTAGESNARVNKAEHPSGAILTDAVMVLPSSDEALPVAPSDKDEPVMLLGSGQWLCENLGGLPGDETNARGRSASLCSSI